MLKLWKVQFGLGLLFVLLFHGAAFAQLGSTLSGIGPINRSMGGAATAAPLDTLGAMTWNPATITALPNSADVSLELLIPYPELSSTVYAAGMADSTNSSRNVFPLPNFGVVYTPEGSATTFGLGAIAMSGFGVNFPGSTTNPLLTPPPPAGIGVGSLYSQYGLFQIVATAATKLTDTISISFSPIVDLASLQISPGFFAAPDDANGNGVATYPSLTNGSYQWGAGFQVGAFYASDSPWQFGASFKSPQWFQTFQYNTHDELGNPRTARIGLDAPMIISIGTAYTGWEKTLLAVDLRYIDYRNTKGYSNVGFAGDGSVLGLGWSDLFTASLGAQYQMNEMISVRAGYSINTNPIPGAHAFYNILSPLTTQNALALGTSLSLSAALKLSLAYTHFFENSVTGPMISPLGGPIPGTAVTVGASADVVTFGASVKF